MRRQLSTLASLAAVLLARPDALAQPAPPASYTITDLGALPGRTSSTAYAINQRGWVVGNSGAGFLWKPDTGPVPLPDIPGGSVTVPHALNLDGDCVGTSGALHAVAWDAPGQSPRELPGAGNFFRDVTGINDAGRAVGHVGYVATLWEPDGTRSIIGPVSPADDFSFAYDINNAGVIVGQSGDSVRGPTVGFRAPPGGPPAALPSFDPAHNAAATAVSEPGAACGWNKKLVTYAGTGPIVVYRAAVWPAAGGVIDLGEPLYPGISSVANGINDRGEIVGETNDTYAEIAWYWTPASGYIDLLTRIPPADRAHWRFLSARGINNSGQIVGEGVLNNNVVRGFLLTPVGAPCRADFNGQGGLSVQDIFDFLGAWFSGAAAADFNGSGGLSVQDIFDFLNSWFAGC